MPTPTCDVCGSTKDVEPWTMRPGQEKPRRRYLCGRCSKPLWEAYNGEREPRGAASIAARVIKD